MNSKKYNLIIVGLVFNFILASLVGITLLYVLKWVDKSYTLVINEESNRLNHVSDLSTLIVNGHVYITNYYNSQTRTTNHENYKVLINEADSLINELNKDISNPSEKVLIMDTNKTFNDYRETVVSMLQNKDQVNLEELEEYYQKAIVACDKLQNYYFIEIDKTNRNNTRISDLVINTGITITILTQVFTLILILLNKKKNSHHN